MGRGKGRERGIVLPPPMQTETKGLFADERPFWWILGVAFALRLVLALNNMEAFDHHMDVVRAIADRHVWPGRDDFWEGFQPKLWHTMVAFIIEPLPTRNIKDFTRIGQLLNAFAGLGTLIFIRKFLAEMRYSRETQIVALALVAFNPMLTGLDAMATNDSFSIVFSTWTLYFGYRWFSHAKLSDFVWMTAGAVLAVTSKANGLITVIAVLCGFVLAALVPAWRARKTVWTAAAFLVVVLLACILFAPYYDHYRIYGSPFITNMAPDPVPAHFFRYVASKYPEWEGVRSGVSWFFTFRYVDLLSLPQLQGGFRIFRTSLPTLLYARWNYVHMGATQLWQNYSALVVWMGRAALILGLLPAAYFLIGLMKSFRKLVADVFSFYLTQEQLARAFLLIAALGYFAFIALYSYKFRNYTCAKAIYIFPGMLSFYFLFAEAYERRDVLKPVLRSAQRVALGLLCCFYIADVLVVIHDVITRVPGREFFF
jgi:hypothetical protein